MLVAVVLMFCVMVPDAYGIDPFEGAFYSDEGIVIGPTFNGIYLGKLMSPIDLLRVGKLVFPEGPIEIFLHVDEVTTKVVPSLDSKGAPVSFTFTTTKDNKTINEGKVELKKGESFNEAVMVNLGDFMKFILGQNRVVVGDGVLREFAFTAKDLGIEEGLELREFTKQVLKLAQTNKFYQPIKLEHAVRGTAELYFTEDTSAGWTMEVYQDFVRLYGIPSYNMWPGIDEEEYGLAD
jgi:hypothetical protein